MVRKTMKTTAYALVIALMFSGMSFDSDAALNSTPNRSGINAFSGSGLPSGGVGLSLANDATALENIAGTENKNIRVSNVTVGNQTLVEEPVEEEMSEEELFKNLVIAQVNNYVNVRSLPDEKSEVVGKLYDNSVGNLLEEENGWYRIESGSVIGYVKGEFCVTGEEAVELAKKVGTRFATVTTTTLKVRTEPGMEAAVLGLVPMDDQLVVSDETEGWVEVDVEEGLGWVSTDYVTLHTEFVTAESKEEEEARIKKEKEEREKARKAAAEKQAKENQAAQNAPSTDNQPTVTPVEVTGGSEMGREVVNYALQFVGNPYVYGGSSLTKGTDCSGFVMSVYANFGVSLPHSSAGDRSQGTAVEGGLDNAQPGDIICYSGHVAIYVGDGQIVHASTKKTGIIVSNASYKKVLAVRRIF